MKGRMLHAGWNGREALLVRREIVITGYGVSTKTKLLEKE